MQTGTTCINEKFPGIQKIKSNFDWHPQEDGVIRSCIHWKKNAHMCFNVNELRHRTFETNLLLSQLIGTISFWESWRNHLVNCEEINICKILGSNVKLKNDEESILGSKCAWIWQTWSTIVTVGPPWLVSLRVSWAFANQNKNKESCSLEPREDNPSVYKE